MLVQSPEKRQLFFQIACRASAARFDRWSCPVGASGLRSSASYGRGHSASAIRLRCLPLHKGLWLRDPLCGQPAGSQCQQRQWSAPSASSAPAPNVSAPTGVASVFAGGACRRPFGQPPRSLSTAAILHLHHLDGISFAQRRGALAAPSQRCRLTPRCSGRHPGDLSNILAPGVYQLWLRSTARPGGATELIVR